jgi:Protein of unknown function (DUF2939)
MRRLLLLLVILAATYAGYPYLTLYWIDRALLTDDQESLEQLVDFPQVRADLKAEVQAQVLGKAQEFKEKRPILGTFGEALTKLFAPDVVDSSVDSMVTPEAILSNPTVVEHREKDESFVDFITYAFFTDPTTFRFDLKDPENPDSPTVTAIMALDGFRWRVVNVEVPPLGQLLSKVP